MSPLIGLFITLFYSARVCNAAELTLRETVYNTDMTTHGIGDGAYTKVGSTYTATISFPGVTGTVNKAYLYWYKLTPSTVATDCVTFDSNAVCGTDIGIASTNCWGTGYSQVFMADITSAITSAAKDYSITGIAESTRSGRNTAINGFSMVVFYDDGDDSNNHDVVLYDGNDSNRVSPFDPAGWNIVLGGINYPASGAAGLELHISDGQNAADGSVVINGDSQTLIADGNQGQYFDIVSFDVTSYMTPNAENTLTITHSVASDCLSAIVALITLPVGAAPIECFDTNDNNPCTSANIAANHLYHPSCTSCCHFIQCNMQGQAFDMPCAGGTYWDPIAYTCNHNVDQCTDSECTQSPIAGAAHTIHAKPQAQPQQNINSNNYIESNGRIMHVKNKTNVYKNYYGYIALIGVIAFILINNVFIGCWCLRKNHNNKVKFEMVGDEEI